MISRFREFTKNTLLFLVEEIQDATTLRKRSGVDIATQPLSEAETTRVLKLD